MKSAASLLLLHAAVYLNIRLRFYAVRSFCSQNLEYTEYVLIDLWLLLAGWRTDGLACWLAGLLAGRLHVERGRKEFRKYCFPIFDCCRCLFRTFQTLSLAFKLTLFSSEQTPQRFTLWFQKRTSCFFVLWAEGWLFTVLQHFQRTGTYSDEWMDTHSFSFPSLDSLCTKKTTGHTQQYYSPIYYRYLPSLAA